MHIRKKTTPYSGVVYQNYILLCPIRNREVALLVFREKSASAQILFHELLDLAHDTASESQNRDHEDTAKNRIYPIP